MTDPKADIVKCGPCAEGVRCRIHSAPDDPRTLTLTAPDGWEYRHRPEGGWRSAWDNGTEWRFISTPDSYTVATTPDDIVGVILVRTPPPTVTITEAQLAEGMDAGGWLSEGAPELFAALRRITGEGE